MRSPVPNLPVETIFRFMCNDFETAWNGVAVRKSGSSRRIGRGNFMFALQTMVLLEWACRLCAGNSVALAQFGKALYVWIATGNRPLWRLIATKL